MTHLSDFALDALRLGMGSAEDRAHLESCEICQKRYRELEVQAQAFLRKAPEPKVVPLAPRRAPWIAGAVVALSAAAAVVLSLSPNQQPDRTRTKGTASPVEVFVVNDGQPQSLHGPVAKDARLTVRVTPDDTSYVRLFWGDEAERSLLYPPGNEAWRVDKASWLPHTIDLDGADETEVLEVLICPTDFDVATGERRAADDEARRRADCRSFRQTVSKK